MDRFFKWLIRGWGSILEICGDSRGCITIRPEHFSWIRQDHAVRSFFQIKFQFSLITLICFRHVVNVFTLIYDVGDRCICIMFVALHAKALFDHFFQTDIDLRLFMLIIMPLSVLLNSVCFICACSVSKCLNIFVLMVIWFLF